jgi:hypothetical protein
MNAIAKFENLKDLIVELRGQSVLIDSDVAELYRVETKRINEAVKNNPDKFPSGYIIELDKTEWDGLKSKFSTSTKGGKVKLPSAFPEKGLYMLYAGHHSQKSAGCAGYPGNHRDFRKNQTAIKKHSGAIGC